MTKKVIKVICFASIFLILFYEWTRVYSFKDGDGIYSIQAFYAQPDNINDVIFVGSSNIFENVNTGILWEDYGIASFDLCGSMQPVWNSYYYIKEALKTQSPKLIVMDVLGVLQTEEYSDNSRIIKNTYGMCLSKDKLEAVCESAPKEKWVDYLLEFPTYHTRYNQISKSDLLPYLGRTNWNAWKGFGINTGTQAQTRPENFETTDTAELIPKVERYLKEICELCRKKDVELLLVKTPRITCLEDTMKYNRAAQIAEEYGVPYIDFNYRYDEIGLDFFEDFADRDHLNYIGNVKFTKYLAEYLKNSYDLMDRRGMEGYELYDIMARDCEMRTYNATVYDTYERKDFLDSLNREEYLIIVTTCGDYRNAKNYEGINRQLQQYGIDLDIGNSAQAWVVQNRSVLETGESWKYDNWHMELAPYKTIEIAADADKPVVLFEGKQQTITKDGINVIVYDYVTESIVDSVIFLIENSEIQNMKSRE